MKQFKKENWELSYGNKDNYIFYPKEEVLKFLSRFVRKRVGMTEFIDVLDSSSGLKGLDFGCGIGRQTVLLEEFGIRAYGIDIAETAISRAREMASFFSKPDLRHRFLTFDGQSIPFEDRMFDVTIAESVLDSMPFDVAKGCIAEIDRVSKNLLFMSLISGDSLRGAEEFSGDLIVETRHEEGTIQSYYNWDRVQKLISDTSFKIIWCQKNTERSLTAEYCNARYYVVLRK